MIVPKNDDKWSGPTSSNPKELLRSEVEMASKEVKRRPTAFILFNNEQKFVQLVGNCDAAERIGLTPSPGV